MLLGNDDLATMPPTVFIGLGGSGAKVVRVLAGRLREESRWADFSKLIHFLCVDTDKKDLANVSRVSRVSNISLDDDKRERIKLLRGQKDHAENKRVSGWVHDWYGFRQTGGKGAGQVRLESRFSMHCQIMDGANNNVRKVLEEILSTALNVKNPNRERSSAVRFFIYGSIAGGTGSGATLLIAYLAREIAKQYGIAHPEVYATLFLPSVFREQVGHELANKVNANGFAALKELEYFMQLRYGAREGCRERIELVYDPAASSHGAVSSSDYVEGPPFDWIYLVDRPKGATIDEIYLAVGEAAYLQLFSPILGMQESAADNWEQLKSSPADGFFAQQYGSVGAASLTFPRSRLVGYCTRRWTLDQLERFVIGKSDHPDGPRHELPEDFEELSEKEKKAQLDLLFKAFIATEAKGEELKRRHGIFTQISELRSDGDVDLLAAFRDELREMIDGARDDLDISFYDNTVPRDNPTLSGARQSISREIKESSRRLDERVQGLVRDIESGDFLTRFFGPDKHKVSALMQRFFLIRLNELGDTATLRDADDEEDLYLPWCFTPFGGEDELSDAQALASARRSSAEFDLDSPDVRKQIAAKEAALVEATSSWFKKDERFSQALGSAGRLFRALIDDTMDDQLRAFWHRVAKALKGQVDKRLDVFRTLAQRGRATVADERAKAKRCLESGLKVGTIGKPLDDAGGFYLGDEIFHDSRAARRQWDLVYDALVRPTFSADDAAVMDAVNGILSEASRPTRGGRRKTEDVLFEIARAIDEIGHDAMHTFMLEKSPLGLGNGLLYEAKMSHLGNRACTLEELEEVGLSEVQAYMLDKLQRAAGQAKPLARLDDGLVNAVAKPYRPRLVGVHAALLQEHSHLQDVIDSALDGVQRVPGWPSADLITFFEGCLGVPLYTYRDVTGPMKRSYEMEVEDARRGLRHVPLHLDGRWEEEGFRGKEGVGLPAIELAPRRSWAKAREQELALERFALCIAGDIAVRDEAGAYSISFRGHVIDLGRGLVAATEGFIGLGDAQREALTSAASNAVDGNPPRVSEAVSHYGGLLFDAEHAGDPAEIQATKRLIATLKKLAEMQS